MRRRYEARDDQWERLKDLLPPEREPQGGRPAIDNRKMFIAMLWVIRSGAPWRDLPEHYDSWSSVYSRFRRWGKADIFDRMLDVLAGDPDDESVMLDASIVRVHQHGAWQKGAAIPSHRTITRRLNQQDSCRCRRPWQSATLRSNRRQHQ